MSVPYYDCKTCGKPFGFGRVFWSPSECGSCSPPPPRKPNCQVCEWATAQTAAYGYDLCWEDFKTLAQVEKITEQRIIKLIDNDFWHHRIWGNPKPTCVQDCPTCDLIALIKGENK